MVPLDPLKVDLHVHSCHSDAPYSWFLRSGKSAECYTPVDHAYQIARRRGMDLVTLADHDCIDGALELCGRYPDTFLSVEVSARFPEDGCIIHLIATAITEAQHRQMQLLRRDVYQLVQYIEQEQIAAFWCHPLSQVNGRLQRSHLERCFLMFRALEIRNGTRDPVHEERLLALIDGISPEQLELWARRHPDTPLVNHDGRYALVGGSDDHGSLAIARAYTTFHGDRSGAGLAAALRASATGVGGDNGDGTVLAHNCYGVLAGYLHASGQADLEGGAAARELGAGAGAEVPPSILRSLIDARRSEPARGSVAERLWNGGHTTAQQDAMRIAAEGMLGGTWRRAIGAVVERASGGRLGELADAVPALIKALMVELPYLLAYRYTARDRRGADRFASELGVTRVRRPRPRVAVFTDTIDDVNGVAIGLRRLLDEARRHDFDLRIVGCGPKSNLEPDADGVIRLPSVYDHQLAEYPELTWSVPHLPPLLRMLAEQEIDLVQCSTPGPVGLAALAAARLTGIPVIGQYHTDVPEYALRLTGDPAVAALVRQLVAWFYRGMDRVLVPSAWVSGVVGELGVVAQNVVRVPRGIDLDAFSPALRDPACFAGLGGGPVLLYVGRLSREKSLDHLLAAFRAIASEVPEARLVLVGDGPLRAELERDAPPGCVLTGVVTGDELARLYASADIFVYPSQTETFGNAVVEAQASGLPVVVAAGTATHELILPGVTGVAVDPSDLGAMRRVLLRLIRDGERRRRMSQAAVQHAARHHLGEALHGTFRCYTQILEELSSSARDAGAPRHELVA